MDAKQDAACTSTRRVYLQSLGCPKNLVDSEIMLGGLASQGYQITTNPREAEVIIVNTCGFLQASAKESIGTILDLAKEKEKGNCRRLVVAGCLSQRYPGELAKELPEVDLFVGTNEYAKIAERLDGIERPYPLYLPTSEMPRLLANASHTAYVKIAEGCNHTCSFCIIPTIRGKQRSRPVEDIVKEVKNLLEMKVKEINLIAQDTTDYGGDLHDGTTLEKLFRALSEIPGDHWFRLMYAYPLRFSDDLIAIMADSPNFCRYVDIPFQHINNRLLRSMRRGSDGGYIRDLVERLRRRIPEIAIRSTFIVGYPGETDEEFEELLEFIREAALERVGVFPFSIEDGTAAAILPDQISPSVKEKRRGILMKRQQELSLKKNRQRIGKNIRVLVETNKSKGAFWGRSEWDAPKIDGRVEILGKKLEIGSFADVTITRASPYDLCGEARAGS